MRPRDQAATVFVGRQDVLAQLKDHLSDAVKNSRARLILIQGDYGLGKTSLVTRFLSAAVGPGFHPQLNIGKGQCGIGTKDDGLVPFIQLVRPDKKNAHWCPTEGTIWDVFEQVAPAWLNIVTAGFDRRGTTADEKQSDRYTQERSPYTEDQVFFHFRNLITELSQGSPLLAWIEDLHWADPVSLKLLDYLSNSLQDVPILIICTYRPVEALVVGEHAEMFREIIDNLKGKGIAEEICLEPDIEAAKYINQRYPANTYPQAVVDLVAKHCAGHPMFLSELFTSWEQTGVIRCERPGSAGAEWRLIRQLDRLPLIPPNISKILDARIRRLPKDLQDLLKYASVAGAEFTGQLMQTLLKLDEHVISSQLWILEKDYRLVHELGEQPIGDLVFDLYQFAHSFYQEHIYHERLSNTDRRSFHRQVGEAMEQLHPAPEVVAGPLARHYEKAGVPLKAATYALLAAQSEQKRYSWLTGEEWCKRGLVQIRKIKDEAARFVEIDLLIQMGEGFYGKGEFEESARCESEAISLAQTAHLEPERLARLYIGIADTYDCQSEYELCLEAVQSAKQLLSTQKKTVTETLLGLLTIEGLAIARQGRSKDAVHLLRLVLAELERRPSIPRIITLKSDANNNLGVALSYLGRYAESTAAFRKAADVAMQIEDTLRAISYQINLVDDLILLGRLGEAEALALQLIELAHTHGDQYCEAYALQTHGALLVKRGEYARAVAILHRSLAVWQDCDNEGKQPYVQADLALAHLGLSELEIAYTHGEQGVEQAAGYEVGLVYALDVMAQVQATRGDWAQAQATYEQSITVAEAAGVRHFAAVAQRHYADLMLRAGDRQRGLKLLARAHTTFVALDLALEIDKTEEVMAKWGIMLTDLPELPGHDPSNPNKESSPDAAILPGEESQETDVSGILAWMGWEAEDMVNEEDSAFHSCFISYSSVDTGFVKKLYKDLKDKGVECWFAEEDMRIGDPFRQRIEDESRQRSKVLLVLSEHSVASDWVASEVEAALERERQQPTKTPVLFPIRVDDAVKRTTAGWAADIRRRRHIGDFTKWRDEKEYTRALDKVLKDLEKQASEK